MITKERAVELILKAADISLGGEIFGLKMPVVRMREVARAVSSYFSGIKIQTIGKCLGEKIYEELMTSEIMRNIPVSLWK